MGLLGQLLQQLEQNPGLLVWGLQVVPCPVPPSSGCMSVCLSQHRKLPCGRPGRRLSGAQLRSLPAGHPLNHVGGAWGERRVEGREVWACLQLRERN